MLKISIKHFIYFSHTNHPPPHPLISHNHYGQSPCTVSYSLSSPPSHWWLLSPTLSLSLSLSLSKASLVKLFQTLNSTTCLCHQMWWGLLILPFSISLSHFLSPNQTLILTLRFLTLSTPSLFKSEPKGKLETHGDSIR